MLFSGQTLHRTLFSTSDLKKSMLAQFGTAVEESSKESFGWKIQLWYFYLLEQPGSTSFFLPKNSLT